MTESFGWFSPGIQVGQRWRVIDSDVMSVHVVESLNDRMVTMLGDDGFRHTFHMNALTKYWELLTK